MANLLWRSKFVSHPGMRRAVNEDAFVDASGSGLWAVADGMGGHAAGQLASAAVAKALSESAATGPNVDENAVRATLAGVNRQLRAISAEEFAGSTLGATVAVLLAHHDAAICLWAGDSRIYRFRDRTLDVLTRDHTWIEQLIDVGALKREMVGSHPLRNYVTRAVGAEESFDLDRRGEPIAGGDVFLMCSDGLGKVVADQEIAEALASGDTLLAPERLLGCALQRGAPDNVTVGVIRFDTQPDGGG